MYAIPISNAPRDFAEFQARLRKSAEECEDDYPITILSATGWRMDLEIRPSSTLADLREVLRQREGIQGDTARFVNKGKPVEEGRLYDQGIRTGSKLHIIVRLRGGMFHPTSSRVDYKPLEARLLLPEEVEDLKESIAYLEALLSARRRVV